MASEASHVWDDTCIASLLRAHGVGLRCKVCHQVFYCLDADSIGEDIIADGEPEELGRLFEVLKRWVVVKVLGTIGPGVEEHGQYLKRYIVCIKDQGFEWLEDPKHLAAIIRNRSKIGAKPQSSLGSKDLGRCDPGVSDELAELEAKLCTSKTGIKIYVSSGDSTCSSKTKCDDVETTSGQAGEVSRGHADALAHWAGSEERYPTHAGLEFQGGHLGNSWVASDEVRALSSGEAELCGIVDGSARGIFTMRMYEEMGRTINVDAETDSTAAIGMSSRTGVGKTRHIQVR